MSDISETSILELLLANTFHKNIFENFYFREMAAAAKEQFVSPQKRSRL